MLPRPYTPDWWLWFTYITPPGWSILAITVDQAGSNVCPVPFLCLACCLPAMHMLHYERHTACMHT